MRRCVAGLCTAVLVGAAASVAAAPVDASTTAPAAFVCTPGTWVHQPANVLPSQGGGLLYAAAVSTPTLAWAVGYYEHTNDVYGALIEKWTGGTSWSVVGTGGKNVVLADVAAFGANSAFAVGTIASGGGSGPEQPVVTHWNGSTWTRTIIRLPSGSGAGGLVAVSGSSSSDVFAMGDYILKGRVYLLVEHWNGSAWTQVTMPSSAKPNAEPLDVVSVGPGDMWMDGYTASEVSRFWHYNGTWTLEATPPGLGPIAGTSDTNIWMVGRYSSSGTPLQHFNGSSWSSVDNNRNVNIVVSNLALGASSSTVWSVGYNGATGGTETVSIAKNGAPQTVPALTGSLNGIGTGSGLAFAVGNTNDIGTGVPIVLASCD
jgi:hypothetical protein